MNNLHTAISFDTFGWYSLEVDGQLVSWQSRPVPEPPEFETVVTYQHVDNGITHPASLIVTPAPEEAE